MKTKALLLEGNGTTHVSPYVASLYAIDVPLTISIGPFLLLEEI